MPHEATFPDRHLEMAEELRDYLAEGLPPADHVSRAYAPDVTAVGPDGKTVWVWPLAEEDGRLTRARVLTEYGFGVVVAQKYADPARPTGEEPVPEAWVDELCGWVRANVYTPLNDAVRKRDRLIPTAWPERCRLAVKYDPARLREAKTFWSEIEVTFREDREG